MKFGVGDKVRIKEFQKEWIYQAPAFIEGAMRKYCGTEFVINKFNHNGFICYKTFYWNEDWLELVIEESEDIESSAFEEIICLHQNKKG